MCCRTNSCCCSRDMRLGIMIAGIIDVMICLSLLIFNIVVARNYGSVWFAVVIIADILMIVGAMTATPGLLIVWLIIGMMNIVFLFIAWIAWPVYAVIHIFVGAAVCVHGIQETLNTGKEAGNLGWCMSKSEQQAWFWVNFIFIIGLPIYYIYLWVVVESHRQNLVASASTIQQMNQHQEYNHQGIINVHHTNPLNQL